MFKLFRRSPNAPLIDRLHGEIMAAARQPAFFLDYGVADTVEGRFEVLSLVASIALGRMARLPSPGPEIAQDVVDAIFRYFDVALREVGVGDLSVPKKMKKMAQGYLGRSIAYRDALAQDDDSALAAALARNVYGAESRAEDAPIRRLARFARAYQAAMEPVDVEALLSRPLPAVNAAAVA